MIVFVIIISVSWLPERP